MIIKDIEKIADNFEGDIFFDYEIKKLNWFNIGGKTRVFFRPNSLKDLISYLKLIKCHFSTTTLTIQLKFHQC